MLDEMEAAGRDPVEVLDDLRPGVDHHRAKAVLLLDKEVAEKQMYKKGTVLEGSLTYAKEKGDDRGITVTVEWKGQGEQGDVEGRVQRTMA